MKKLISNLLGRLRLWQKLSVLGWIVAMLLAVPFYQYFTSQQATINATAQEQQGLEPNFKLLGLLQATAKHRDVSADFLADKDPDDELSKQKTLVNEKIAAYENVIKRLDYPGLAAQWLQFKEEWAKIGRGIENRSVTREQNFAAHNKLNEQGLALIQAVMDGSRLSLDPDADTYNLAQAVFTNAALLNEKLGQMRGLGSLLLTRAEDAAHKQGKPVAVDSVQERAAVFSMANRANESHDSLKIQLAQFQLFAPGNAKTQLDGPASNMALAIDKSLTLARQQIVEASVLSFAAKDYASAFKPATEATFAFSQAGYQTLQDLFALKLDKARAAQRLTLTFVSVALLLAALIAYFILRSITEPVQHLTQVMDKLAKGDNSVRAKIDSTDEIGELGRHFDQMMDERDNSELIRQQNEQLNNSVIDLMQAVAKLADKDLTVKVPVAEDITGLVADAINLLSQETAGVMNRVVAIAANVAQISGQVKAQSDTVIGVAAAEKREVEQAAAELSLASNVMQDIAQLALSCNQAAEQAIKNTDKAQQTVLGTVEGITAIRDTIRETEKRIKRLGERSQEIGGVVNLINGIAERTHILAINASMHAASAGEAGRSFAVVANEVQKLAENAREATSKIAGLVNNIQLETADTVTTMNDAISQVVRGTTLAQQAGSEMRETRDTTANLVQLVRRIAENSNAQAQTSLHLLERAVLIQKGTDETYAQLQAQGVQTGQLVGYSAELVNAVGVFTLPKAVTA